MGVTRLLAFLSGLNWLDVIVLIIFIRTSYVGWQQGLANEIFRLLGGVITLLITVNFYDNLGGFVSQHTPIPSAEAELISFLFLLVFATFVLEAACFLLGKIGKLVFIPMVDKYGGLICGICRGFVFAGLVVTALSLVPINYIQRSKDSSLTGLTLQNGVKGFSRFLTGSETTIVR